MSHYATEVCKCPEISQKEEPETFTQNKAIAKRGGKVAGIARKETEKELGRSVVSSQNYLSTTRPPDELELFDEQ